MNIRAAFACSVISLAVLVGSARAAPTPVAKVEIAYLLQHIEESGCEFYRNGTWYDGKRARAHLTDKYDYLTVRNQIVNTDDFIEKAATKSSFSGLAYEIRCGNGAPVESNPWLRKVLAVYRSTRQNPPIR